MVINYDFNLVDIKIILPNLQTFGNFKVAQGVRERQISKALSLSPLTLIWPQKGAKAQK